LTTSATPTPMTSHSRRLRVTVGPSQAEALRLLALESGLSLAQEAGALLRLGIRTAWRRYATLYGLPEVPRVSAEELAEIDRRLGYDNKPAEGELSKRGRKALTPDDFFLDIPPNLQDDELDNPELWAARHPTDPRAKRYLP
jgi:hypothetical protein